ncbi:MAG: hypothetical protein I3270_02405 [Candidatus Moeniiplasma glomeromycotorum]|nr:hypothetical protein [Candidatus Moeniiplasma glomeromycotorum]MCE8166475.1 hypothetical protein [Candidatus Moeniiplasma glomeromycotorum]MCE8166984.1 hypothetical protein [Candidatus Moeniiplasma glomeromycotorum]
MTQIAETKTKIVLLLFIPIVNSFNFPTPTEKWGFFDLAETRKKFLSSEKKSLSSKEELLKLFEIDYTLSIKELIDQKESAKLVIINYPSNEKHFASFQQELTKRGKKVDQIILLTISKYELILNLKNKYLICPICEKITKREESVQDSHHQEKIFVCSHHPEYQFSLAAVEQFNEKVIEYYLLNTKKVVENFLKAGKTPLQLNIVQEEDIFSGKVQAEIIKIIENL